MMRLGVTGNLNNAAWLAQVVDQGFEFIEIIAASPHLPSELVLPPVSFVWRCPADLPIAYPNATLQEAVRQIGLQHLAAAAQIKAALLVVQFQRPPALGNKQDLIQTYVQSLMPLVAAGRERGVQVVLRNGHDNRDQLQLLREIVRTTPGLGIALDIAYAHQNVVKPLVGEFLWDSDLGPRIAHVIASDTTGSHPDLRLPPGCLGAAGVDWQRVVRDLRERYNASVTLDAGETPLDFLTLSRKRWLALWGSR